MNDKVILKYLLAFTTIISLCACGKIEFSEKGQIAIDQVKELKSYMKAPDTFILKDNVLVIDENDITFVFIVYSAENGFGVPLQDMDIFYDGEYYGSYYDMEKYYNMEENKYLSRADYETQEAYTDALEKRKDELLSLLTFTQWKLGKIDDYEVISCKSIAKELGIKYQIDNN